MKKFMAWLENSDLGYYVRNSEDGKYVEYLIDKYNGVVVRCYYGLRMAQLKNADGTWMRYSYKKLMEDLQK